MLLTLGCMVKQVNFSSLFNSDEQVSLHKGATLSPNVDDKDNGIFRNPVGIILIFLQVIEQIKNMSSISRFKVSI